jgi:3-oxoacyl-[acyl-carrier-protein] synthase II
VIPATGNLLDPEPEPRLDLVREPRTATVDIAVSNSFGFGGHNACIVLRRA